MKLDARNDILAQLDDVEADRLEAIEAEQLRLEEEDELIAKYIEDRTNQLMFERLFPRVSSDTYSEADYDYDDEGF